MAITIDQLKAMSFGYLTGADLVQFAAGPLLIKQYEVNPDSLQNACDFAQGRMRSAAINRYDIMGEFAKTGGAREKFCVQITALIACSNALANAVNIGELLHSMIKQALKDCTDIRNGQANLDLPAPPSLGLDDKGIPIPYPASEAGLVRSSFNTLG